MDGGKQLANITSLCILYSTKLLHKNITLAFQLSKTTTKKVSQMFKLCFAKFFYVHLNGFLYGVRERWFRLMVLFSQYFLLGHIICMWLHINAWRAQEAEKKVARWWRFLRLSKTLHLVWKVSTERAIHENWMWFISCQAWNRGGGVTMETVFYLD